MFVLLCDFRTVITILKSVMDFFAMNCYLLRSLDTQPDLLMLHGDDSHANVFADHDFFAHLAGQDEHE